jgi:hypothetical protein
MVALRSVLQREIARISGLRVAEIEFELKSASRKGRS